MNLHRLSAGLTGYLTILVRGVSLERLLNLASAKGIYLWEIRRYRPDLLVVNVGCRGFRAMRPLLRRTRCRARIRRRRGCPFLWRRLARRPGFIAGGAAFLAVLLAMTSFIWRVELVGTKTVSPASLRHSLRDLGLYPGVLRGRLNKDRIQRELEIATPAAAWISVEIRGMVAVVRIVERAVPETPALTDLVAGRDGLIDQVLVYQGTPLVKEGETVRAGQVLVSAREVTVEPDGELVERLVPANARIEARVWDEARAAIPLHYWRQAPTGKAGHRLTLRLGRFSWSFHFSGSHFAWFQQSRSAYGLRLGRNSPPLVELVIDRYNEQRIIPSVRTVAEAEALGRRATLASLRGQLGQAYREASVRTAASADADWVEVVSVVESRQDIAVASRGGP